MSGPESDRLLNAVVRFLQAKWRAIPLPRTLLCSTLRLIPLQAWRPILRSLKRGTGGTGGAPGHTIHSLNSSAARIPSTLLSAKRILPDSKDSSLDPLVAAIDKAGAPSTTRKES